MKLFKQMAPEFTDERGDIIKVLDDGETTIKSILFITCKSGAIRANHYHKKDSHYCYLTSGKMEYYERPVGSDDIPAPVIVEAGDMVYTSPMMEHAMRFIEDSAFWTFSTQSRGQAAYEEDVVRVKII